MLYSYQASYAIAYVAVIPVRIPHPILPPWIVPRLVKGLAVGFQVKILGEGEERNFPLGEILLKAKFLCSPQNLL